MAKEWEAILSILGNHQTKLSVAVTACWVERNGDLIPFPKKFPEEAKVLKEMLRSAGFRDQEIRPIGSLGAVMHDLLYVAFGYAIIRKKPNLSFILRISLSILKPIFSCIDSITREHKTYITTGYFVIAHK